MVEVRDGVGKAHGFGLEGRRWCNGIAGKTFPWLSMSTDAVQDFKCKIQSPPRLFQQSDDADTLLVVPISFTQQVVERPLTGVTERSMPEIVRECDSFG